MSEEFATDTVGFCDECAVSRGTHGCEHRYMPNGDDLAESLDAVRAFLTEYVVFPDEHCEIAAALWCAHTHAVDSFDSTPRLAFLSPEPGSGKSRALEVITTLVPAPMHAVNASPAALFRAVSDEDNKPTILFDEVDTIFGPKARENEELRGFVNAGHRKGAVSYRCVGLGSNQVVQAFPAYCAMAIAGLNDLPDTISTRSVIVRMRKRAPSEQVKPWRARTGEPVGTRLRLALRQAVRHVDSELKQAEPVMPPGVEDRPADVWEPLLAIADCAGGEWPVLARDAATHLTRGQGDEPSLGVLLLTDIRQVFTEKGDPAHIATTDLIEALHLMDEAPWASIKGEGMTPRRLSSYLSRYGVKSGNVRGGPVVLRGYSREDLWDVWQRYCPVQGDGVALVADVADTREGETPLDVADVALVAEVRQGERPPLEVVRDEDDWADLLAELDDEPTN